MDNKTKDLITLAFEIECLAHELKIDYDYLSEEIDRWGEKFNYDKPSKKDNESYKLVRENIQKFEQEYQLVIKVGLDKHPIISKILEDSVKYIDKIKKGDFLRLNLVLDNMSLSK